MSGKRLISSITWSSGVYSSQPIVREYIEYRLFDHCAKSGLDARGAHDAHISGGAKKGGYYKSEPFHLTFKVQDMNHKDITTTNPYTKLETKSHHFYLADNLQDLKDKAAAWDKARKTAQKK